MAEKVYSVIYWYEKMRDGTCTASNSTIARILRKGNSSSVSNAIAKLIDAGFVTAEYDPASGIRTSMNTFVGFYPTPNDGPPTPNDVGTLHQMMEHNKNNKKNNPIVLFSSEITKLYEGYLIEFIIGIDVWVNADGDLRTGLLTAARSKVRLTEKRKAKIASRLEDLDFTKCAAAIKHVAQSEFHRGENDRRWMASIEWIFSSVEKTEEWSNKK